MRPEDEPIEYTSIENPEWVDNKFDAIVCSVKFSHRRQPEDFVARRNDAMPYGREIFERCFKGEFGWLMLAPKSRTDKLYMSTSALEQYVVGDIHSNSTDEELQGYILRHNTENRSGSETGTVIALGSILDHLLKRLLEKRKVYKRLSFKQKIEQALSLNIITESESQQLNLIREIRNAFGHDHEVSFSDESQKLKCEELYRAVVGDAGTPSLRLQFSSAASEIMANLLSRLPKA